MSTGAGSEPSVILSWMVKSLALINPFFRVIGVTEEDPRQTSTSVTEQQYRNAKGGLWGHVTMGMLRMRTGAIAKGTCGACGV